jgi:two-component system, NtrC family, sensor kinase
MSQRDDEVVDVLIRLSQGDMSARVARTYTQDVDDAIAYCINMLASEFGRMTDERERNVRHLEDGVTALSKSFAALAGGDYSARVARNGTGDPVDVLARLFNDTAAQIQEAVLAIDEQRAVLEAMLEALPDPVLLLDAGGKVLRANGAAVALFGQREALMGMPLWELAAEDERPFIVSLADRVARGPVRNRDTGFRIAGGQATLPVSASGYGGAEGRIGGVVVVIHDDRDLRAARAQLQMTDRLAAMGTIAAGVAHEINNPLAFVISNLDFVMEALGDDETALHDEDGQEIRDALAAAHRGSDRVRQIVQDLQTFSVADRDTIEPLDVNQLVQTAVSILNNQTRHHATVVLDLGSVPLVEANETKLGQVFINLIHNAAQSIPSGHASDNTIRIATTVGGASSVVVTVQDTGKGIEPRHMSRIFDAFYTTKPAGAGTGLGLAICQQVVSKLGGHIAVESTVGMGTTFTVTLPAARPSAMISEAPPVEAAQVARRRILVIDDEIEVGQSVRRILRRQHDVDAVQRAHAALELLQASRYDVILCDMMMPEMDGISFYRQLESARPELAGRVVFMSGGAFSPEARAFLATHRGPTVQKPFQARTLRTLIETVVNDG